jgi:Na+/H+ antiporter NhaD/arsenite permease-like protein
MNTWPFSVIVLAAVFLLIAVRQVGRFRLRIWQIMCGGAAIVLVTGQISVAGAIASIEPDVMLFLLGMFFVGVSLEKSGGLAVLSARIAGRISSPRRLILFLLFSMGLLSAVLMNDTVAIIGTPMVLCLAKRYRVAPEALLMTLCIAVTTGSVMSPIGNPQNLLIAINSGIPNPFVAFFVILGPVTLVGLGIGYIVLRVRYQLPEGQPEPQSVPLLPDPDSRLTPLAISSLVIIAVCIGMLVAGYFIPGAPSIPLFLIALFAAAPPFLFSPRRWEIARALDWPTLAFFMAMFVLMTSVFETGFFQFFFDITPGTMTIPVLLGMSVGLSQFISNVPFVALFQPLLAGGGLGIKNAMALAAGSTIAGNLTILGAASNVIIIQRAEQDGESLSFLEFLKVGVPVTILQCGVCLVFLSAS